jgi:hypothetical protein
VLLSLTQAERDGSVNVPLCPCRCGLRRASMAAPIDSGPKCITDDPNRDALEVQDATQSPASKETGLAQGVGVLAPACTTCIAATSFDVESCAGLQPPASPRVPV